MWWKVLGVAVLLAVLGAVGGYAVAQDRDGDTVGIGSPGPVAAQSPAAPTIAPVTCLPDPTLPALQPGLPAGTSQTLRTGRKRGFAVSLAVPDGWSKTQTDSGTWKFAPAPIVSNAYILRATIVADQHVAPEVYLQSRIAAYRSTQRNGFLQDFQVESQAGDTFVATYSENGFCRVSVERVLTLGTSSAYVDLAVTGREEDRQGMLDLLARTTTSMSPA